jgi:hypothetical protein
VTGQGQRRDSAREAVDRPLLQTARSRDASGSLQVTVLIEPMTEDRQALLAADLLDILGRWQRGGSGSRGQLSALGSDDHE